jgi:hypothetical protein
MKRPDLLDTENIASHQATSIIRSSSQTDTSKPQA